MQKEYTHTVDGLINGGGGLYPGGLVSGIIYSLANGWAYNRGLIGILRYVTGVNTTNIFT